MADCLKGIAKSIISDCTTSGIGGNEIKAWIGNRLEIVPTYSPTNPVLVTALTMVGTAVLYTITGVKKLLNSGFDRVLAADRPDKFTHYFNFQGFEFDAASVQDLDNFEDVVVIVESKDKPASGDGVFRIYGLKNGLYPSSDTSRANDINGARNIELTSLDGQEEMQSNYVLLSSTYAATLSMLVGLETP